MSQEVNTILAGLGPIDPSTIIVEGPSPVPVSRIIAALLAPSQAEAAAIVAVLGPIAPVTIIVEGTSPVSVARIIAALLNPGSQVSPGAIPNAHSGHITLSLAGANTAWVQGSTLFTPSGVANVTKISQNVSSPTAATVVVTTGAGTGALTVTESVTGTATFTVTVGVAAISLSPASGATGTVPTVTVNGTNTVWTQEVSSTLFSESGGTGASIGTITVATDTSASFPLTVGSAGGPLTITDAPTSDTATFTATTLPATEVFWGYSLLGDLSSAQIVALQSNATGSAPPGTYPYTIPGGANYYYYLCYPDSWGDFTAADIGAFNWSVAGTGDADGTTYSHSFTGAGIPYTYALVTVTNSPAPTVAYRVFRSQYYSVTGGSFSIVVT